MKKSSVFSAQKSTSFQILYCVLERWTRTHNQILTGKTSWRGLQVHHNTELWTQLMVSQWNSSGIFSQDSPHCSSVTKSKSSLTKMGKPEQFQGRIIFMSMFNEKESLANATLVSSTPTSSQHWKHLYTWERITQIIYIPSKVQGTISRWNGCSTYLKSW